MIKTPSQNLADGKVKTVHEHEGWQGFSAVGAGLSTGERLGSGYLNVPTTAYLVVTADDVEEHRRQEDAEDVTPKAPQRTAVPSGGASQPLRAERSTAVTMW